MADDYLLACSGRKNTQIVAVGDQPAYRRQAVALGQPLAAAFYFGARRLRHVGRTLPR